MKMSADENGSFMKMEVEAEFATFLSPSQIAQVLHLVLEILSGSSSKGLFLEGISFLQVDPNNIHIRFRYTTNWEDIKSLDAESRNILPMRQSQFVFYVFAAIDQKFSLGKVPFPPDYRSFINFPD